MPRPTSTGTKSPSGRTHHGSPFASRSPAARTADTSCASSNSIHSYGTPLRLRKSRSSKPIGDARRPTSTT